VKLRREGFRGFLMGETFMKTDNPPLALNKFIDELRRLQKSDSYAD
jgi:indole-3-glycerol phosphate synthase